jgi:hypothetical protein
MAHSIKQWLPAILFYSAGAIVPVIVIVLLSSR